ncbi:hypothetical protein [Euzebya pacifica]|jgi:hypothetical protein|uniref:hypothetical protein n=1 Tax=Euzebya pacifica TaxID=1608957 RepID=UPI0030F8FB17
MHRLLSTALLTMSLLILAAAPAAAHGRGSDASNFESRITETPSLDGLEWRVINSDEYLQLTNASSEEVAIPGYQGEPYLRIGPDGVFRNLNSQATYLNEDRFAQTTIPADVDLEADPEWEQLSDGSSYAWHDHRIHWMADTDPPAVKAAPDETHLVTAWTVPFEVGGEEHEVAGDLTWVPGGSALLWLLPALLLVSIPVALAVRRTEPDVDAARWPGLSRVAGTVLLAISVLNLIHLVDDLFATPVPISQSAFSAIQTAFFIAIAVFGAVATIRGRDGAFTALGVGAGAIFIGQGLLYISVLSASQTASIFPGWLTRAAIAASVAQILPLGVAAVVGTRALLPSLEDDWDPEPTIAEGAA